MGGHLILYEELIVALPFYPMKFNHKCEARTFYNLRFLNVPVNLLPMLVPSFVKVFHFLFTFFRCVLWWQVPLVRLWLASRLYRTTTLFITNLNIILDFDLKWFALHISSTREHYFHSRCAEIYTANTQFAVIENKFLFYSHTRCFIGVCLYLQVSCFIF